MADDKKCSCMIHIIIALIVGFLLGALITYLLKSNNIKVSMSTESVNNKSKTDPKKKKTTTSDDEEDLDELDEVEGFKNVTRHNVKNKSKPKGKKIIWKGKQSKQGKKKFKCNC